MIPARAERIVRLGDDIANELVDWFNAVDLTYRTELREQNELNFARSDAKLEQRLAELRAEFRAELSTGRAELRAGVADVRTAMADLRTELVRWMFGFWVTTLMALAGLWFASRH